MRRTGIRTASNIEDESGFKPGSTLIAVHKSTGKEIRGIYKGLSASKKTLKIDNYFGKYYVNPADYEITLKEE